MAALGLLFVAISIAICSAGGRPAPGEPGDSHAHARAALNTSWVGATGLATDLPEIEPNVYVEPIPEPPMVEAAAVSTPAPYVPPAPVQRVTGAGVEQWRELVASIFPAENVDAALRVMWCESKGNPNATGAQGERGLFQIHPRWHPDATYDPEGNVRAAYRISGGGYSWGAWTCKP